MGGFYERILFIMKKNLYKKLNSTLKKIITVLLYIKILIFKPLKQNRE